MDRGADEVLAALARHGVVVVRVQTGSMRPTLEVGAEVTVRAAAPRVGDVALLRGPNGFIVHRLVARLALPGRVRFVHAGDAPGAHGGLCGPDEILGVAELAARVPPLLERARKSCWALARAVLRRTGARARGRV